MEVKQQSTGNNDSVEDAVIAIMNIKTTEGKLINFNAQVKAVYEALAVRELYTTSLTWQGLSDEEILKAVAPKGTSDSDWNVLKLCNDIIMIGHAIEQALKEKNNGT